MNPYIVYGGCFAGLWILSLCALYGWLSSLDVTEYDSDWLP